MSAVEQNNLVGLVAIRRNVSSMITPDDLAEWAIPQDVELVADLTLIWVQIGLGVALYLVWPSPIIFLISWFLIGGAQHGCGLVAHEGAHQLVCHNNPKLNDAICRWMFAAPTGLPFHLYRQRHLAHHRLVSTPSDTKRLYQRSFRGYKMCFEVLRSLLGFDYIQQVLSAISSGTNDKQIPKLRSRLILEDLLSIVFSNLVLLALFSAIDWRLYFLLWALPLVSTSVLWSKFRSVVEHYPIVRENPGFDGAGYFRGTRVPILRSVNASLFEKLFFSKLNFHYHAEHHLWPKISYQFLPLANQRLTDNFAWDIEGLNRGSSYLQTLRNIFLEK